MRAKWMTLEEYRQKRKFEETPEPEGKVLETGKQRFVVQEHWARNHHFDFRLELDGVLKSFAVPKGVPQEKGIKRLAVQTEDHPVEYFDFEGIIPEGCYGAGTVKIFDRGEYELVERAEKRLEFKLRGKKFKGTYNLIKFREPNQWLLFKV